MTPALPALGKLTEDIVGSDHGILQVGTGFTLEAERFGEVEGNDGSSRVLEEKVTQGADSDLAGDFLSRGGTEFRLSLLDFEQGFLDQLVDQIVGLDPQPFSS